MDATDAFAEEYRRQFLRENDSFTLFGLGGGVVRRRGFDDDVYVPLTVRRSSWRGGGWAAPDEVVETGQGAGNVVGALPRALVRGTAGSGKSTLLKNLACRLCVEVPESEVPAVPFFLQLAHYPDGRLPENDELLVPRQLRADMPENWVRRYLKAGRAVFFVDGLDEVQPSLRHQVEIWVEERMNSFPDVRWVMATRPSVVAENWWTERGFEQVDLLQMSRDGVERFVGAWHRIQFGFGDTAGTDVVADASDQMLRTVRNRPALSGMSANPLLCGLLCMLHQRLGRRLPESRAKVYEQGITVLLEQRVGDQELSVTTGRQRLKLEEVQELLHRLAYWLVRNDVLVLSADDVRDRVRKSLVGLGAVNGPPPLDEVIEFLAHECGVVGETRDGSLEFVHQTFRDYLAAQDVLAERDIGLMLDCADKSRWHDVVVMAGACADRNLRGQIVAGLLDKGENEPQNRDKFTLLASAILDQNTVLPPDASGPGGLHQQVRRAVERLIPPKSLPEAEQLAEAGSFVLDLLPEPEGLDDLEKERTVRTIARVAARGNAPRAREKLLQFVQEPLTDHLRLQVLDMWGRVGDYEEYARDLLAVIDFSEGPTPVNHQKRIDHIGHLRSITHLVVQDDARDLSPLASLPVLERLDLLKNLNVDLAGIARAPSLRVIRLVNCAARTPRGCVDLAPVVGLSLTLLSVTGLLSKVDVTTLVGGDVDELELDVGQPVELPAYQGRRVSVGRHVTAITGFARVEGLREVVLARPPAPDELTELNELTDRRPDPVVVVPTWEPR